MVKGTTFQNKAIRKGDANLVITHKLKMSLEEEAILQRVEMPLGDAGSRQIEMLLFSRQNPWTIPEDVTVLIRYKKPDGTMGEYDTLPDGAIAWSAAGNALTVAVAPQVLTAAGSVQLYACLYLEEKVLHTFAVEISVKAPFGKMGLRSSASSQDYQYTTNILRGPVMAQEGDVLTVGAVDAYGKATAVEALSVEKLMHEKSSAVLYAPQKLTGSQKQQACENIGAQEKITRTEGMEKCQLTATETDFVDVNGKLVWECEEKQDWIYADHSFDFECTVEVAGVIYTFKKSDCMIIDGSCEEDYFWMLHTALIPNFGTILHIGNGMDPVTREHNEKLSIACFADRVISMSFNYSGMKTVEAKPVVSINGKLPNWNGDISMPQEQVMYTQQSLTAQEQAQARSNIAAAPSGFGWGEKGSAAMQDNDANKALITGLYRANSTTANVPADCNMVFVQAASTGFVYQTAYCQYAAVATRLCDHDEWTAWEKVQDKKNYQLIATATVSADGDGKLPQYVTFEADSAGKTLALTDFIIKANAGFVDGNQSTLYMNINGGGVIVNGAIPSIGTSCRGFNIFFRRESDGCKRVEYTASMVGENIYNAQAAIAGSRLIPPMTAFANAPITKIDLFTQTGTQKAWVEGSTFQLWGVRV